MSQTNAKPQRISVTIGRGDFDFLVGELDFLGTQETVVGTASRALAKELRQATATKTFRATWKAEEGHGEKVSDVIEAPDLKSAIDLAYARTDYYKGDLSGYKVSAVDRVKLG